MIEQQEMVEIDKQSLIETVAALKAWGFRLVQICCTTLNDCYEMNYSFDRNHQFRNLRFTIGPNETIPSITVAYASAFLYENEIHDLFGIAIEHITIDYHGTLYRTNIPFPFGLKTRPPENASRPPTAEEHDA